MYQEIKESSRKEYDRLVKHPLQSWAWGQFREKTGVRVIRLGQISNGKLISPLQVFFHKLPVFNLTVGYLPKGPLPNKEMVQALVNLGKKHNAIFLRLEPNALVEEAKENIHQQKEEVNNAPLSLSSLLTLFPNFLPNPRPLFTKYTFLIDLTKSEEELMQSFSQKTRYNIRLAQKHGVTIVEDNTDIAFNRYLELTKETTRRQGFYAHDENYHRKMWQTLHQSVDKSGNIAPSAHLLTARYQNQILVAWILFLFHDVLYYPYGASATEHKQVMASNLMMWEAIRFGKKYGAKLFDLWGTPGPNPKPEDPYFGFHRFKLGYSPKLVEFVGSYDLVINPVLYRMFNFINSCRWKILKKIH